MASSPPPRYIDIGINLSDAVYSGRYHGTQRHEADLSDVIARAQKVGCAKFMVTGSDVSESRAAVAIAQKFPGVCFATVGVHPCAARQFEEGEQGAEAMLAEVEELARESKAQGYAAAFGEIGLDYDRLFLTGKEQQLRYFERQLEVAVRVGLPLFLHSRAASEDFERLLKERLPELPKGGLVHSFTGTMEEMRRLIELGLDIGVNGCSLKTEENVEVVKEIPLDRLQLETDGPWCEMRASHASAKYLTDAPPLPRSVKKEKWEKGCLIKGRNEPVAIYRVAHAVAKIKGVEVEVVTEAAWKNSVEMFGLGEQSP